MNSYPNSILFDLDGTLIDSAPQVRAAVNMVLKDHGHRMLAGDEIVPLLGRGARQTIEGAFMVTGGKKPSDFIDRRVDDYLRYYLDDPKSHTVIYPGVIDVLNQMRGLGIAMGVCTNKPSLTTHTVLEALGLTEFFAAVMAADDVKERKPAAGHIFETLASMGVNTERAVYVGDSEIDMAAARNAGIPAIAVTYGYCDTEPENLDADILIDTFDQLPDALIRNDLFKSDSPAP